MICAVLLQEDVQEKHNGQMVLLVPFDVLLVGPNNDTCARYCSKPFSNLNHPSHSSIVSLFASFFCWFVKVFMNLRNSFACPLVAGNLYIGSPIGSWSFVNGQKQ